MKFFLIPWNLVRTTSRGCMAATVANPATAPAVAFSHCHRSACDCDAAIAEITFDISSILGGEGFSVSLLSTNFFFLFLMSSDSRDGAVSTLWNLENFKKPLDVRRINTTSFYDCGRSSLKNINVPNFTTNIESHLPRLVRPFEHCHILSRLSISLSLYRNPFVLNLFSFFFPQLWLLIYIKIDTKT